MLDHLNTNNLLDPHQSAYDTGHSTETALLKVVNDLLTALDNRKISILSLLDLSAAFVIIDHKTLLSRLESSYGICDTDLAWFRSYLIDRSQFQSMVVTQRFSLPFHLNSKINFLHQWYQYSLFTSGPQPRSHP